MLYGLFTAFQVRLIPLSYVVLFLHYIWYKVVLSLQAMTAGSERPTQTQEHLGAAIQYKTENAWAMNARHEVEDRLKVYKHLIWWQDKSKGNWLQVDLVPVRTYCSSLAVHRWHDCCCCTAFEPWCLQGYWTACGTVLDDIEDGQRISALLMQINLEVDLCHTCFSSDFSCVELASGFVHISQGHVVPTPDVGRAFEGSFKNFDSCNRQCRIYLRLRLSQCRRQCEQLDLDHIVIFLM